jgi:hypothetical protein
MCYYVGIKWGCPHRWEGWRPCQRPDVVGRDCPGVVTAKSKYWDKEAFIRVPWDCCSSCCKEGLKVMERKIDGEVPTLGSTHKDRRKRDEDFITTQRRYYADDCRTHSLCFQHFVSGHSITPSMRQDMKRGHREDDVPMVRKDCLPSKGTHTSDLDRYKGLVVGELALYCTTRTSLEQYEFIKAFWTRMRASAQPAVPKVAQESQQHGRQTRSGGSLRSRQKVAVEPPQSKHFLLVTRQTLKAPFRPLVAASQHLRAREGT